MSRPRPPHRPPLSLLSLLPLSAVLLAACATSQPQSARFATTTTTSALVGVGDVAASKPLCIDVDVVPLCATDSDCCGDLWCIQGLCE